MRGAPAWVAFTLVLMAAATVGSDVSRLEKPQGERYVNYMDVWPSDFRAGLEATRSLLAGKDPYLVALPGAKASDRFVIDGVTYRFCYPPAHLLIYVPIALAVRDDEKAGRAWFYVQLAMLLVLAIYVWLLADALMPTPPLAIAAVLPLLVIQPGALLALERVQSDVVVAFLAWSAVVTAQRGRWGWASFLAVAAALVKPYAALLAVGIVGAGVERAQLRASAMGAVAALAALFAPVARYLPESLRAVRVRSDLFWPAWQNWALQSAGWAIDHAFARGGRALFGTLCVAAAALSWLCLRRAMRTRDRVGVTLWLVLFAVCALEGVIGWSHTAYNYAMVYLLPGLLVAALAQPAIAERLALSRRERWLTAPAFTALLVGFWIVRPWWSSAPQPVAAFAIVLIVWLIGSFALASLLSRESRPSAPDPAA
ncbi:MAG: hypothetical protein JWM53_5922 [bacterium]|nr:hypothetical protein [bacterium]